MKQAQELSRRFEEVILNGTWIANTNFHNELFKLDYQIAEKRFNNLNSIALLSQHIHYYIKGVKNVFLGGSLDIRDKYSFDFEPFTNQEDWESFLTTFWADAKEFALLVKKLSNNELNQPFVDEKYGSYQRNIEAMIEHCYYHLGQIVLLKKINENI